MWWKCVVHKRNIIRCILSLSAPLLDFLSRLGNKNLDLFTTRFTEIRTSVSGLQICYCGRTMLPSFQITSQVNNERTTASLSSSTSWDVTALSLFLAVLQVPCAFVQLLPTYIRTGELFADLYIYIHIHIEQSKENWNAKELKMKSFLNIYCCYMMISEFVFCNMYMNFVHN